MLAVKPEQFRGVAKALRTHYGQRYGMLVLLETKHQGLLECLLVLEGEVNTIREVLRVEPVARLHSSIHVELAILPISRRDWDAALEPEVWEAHWTGTRL
jgi:hypothetical protein